MTEFGGSRFGATYGLAAARWIRSHYVPVSDPNRSPVVMLPVSRESPR
jgi:hypothetical protein